MEPWAKVLTSDKYLEGFPLIGCPRCSDGFLRLSRKASGGRHDVVELYPYDPSEYDDYMDVEGFFSGVFACNMCPHESFVVGDLARDYVYDDRHEQQPADVYRVRNIYPPVRLMERRAEMPASVMVHVARAEQLLWLDAPAAMTTVRAAVEALMVEQGVDIKPTLAGTLNAFKTKNQMLFDFFTATRYMGNAATHANDALTSEVFEQLYFLETALNILYPSAAPDYSDAVARAKAIAAAKGPVR